MAMTGLDRLFEAQVARIPRQLAIETESVPVTYRELSIRARELAARLAEAGVDADSRVAIRMPRSPEFAIAILSVLKARACYLPVDPRYPQERVQFMLGEAGCDVMITQRAATGEKAASGVAAMAVERVGTGRAASSESPVTTRGEPLAYVMFTSGSTGRPKGVAMVHGALMNLLEWHQLALPMKVGTRTLQFTSPSFDVSFQELFTTWCGGGTIVMMPEDLRYDPRGLWQYLTDKRIERMFVPFVTLQQLAEASEGCSDVPTALREVITAGEQLQITRKIRAMFERMPSATLHNHYGPTETHVVTSYTLPSDRSIWPLLPPIGKPISNVFVYLLDERLLPVADGEVGELYLAGACLARGYWGQPALTRERFLPDPFDTTSGGRMYRTGDLGRLLPDGNIEFLGRKDQQVKIRGFRVELGEIESALGQHPGVKECAARTYIRASEVRLAACVVPRPGHQVVQEELGAFLKTLLPDYMIPAAYLTLPALPLTPSGKLDRQALPEPPLGTSLASLQAPLNGSGVEGVISAIWREVLEQSDLGLDASFFDAGGSSLTMVAVQRRLSEALGREVSIPTLFRFPTIRALANHLQSNADTLERGHRVSDRAARQREAVGRQRRTRGTQS